jgi:tRNA1Val (adenine37-N6)-methyltransferase
VARQIAFLDPELGPVTDDLLTPDVRVFQRKHGHRFSSDDVATAYVAYAARPGARRIFDMGSGLGSVLLLLAWKFPDAELCGVEAQTQSFELLRRNVQRSGFSERCRIAHGDLRDPALMTGFGGNFDLVTGTPPYFPPDAALDAEDGQRAYARIEYRGGIEAYIDAGARLLSADGSLVVCGDARALQRTTSAAANAGVSIHSRCDVLPRAGRDALFSVWTLRRAVADCSSSVMTLRTAAGAPTVDAVHLREFCGFVGRIS